jgi:cell shape-determining protein MreD
MHHLRFRIYLVAALALLPTLFIRAIFPSLNLAFLVPFIVYCYYRTSFASSLWVALGCGLLIDLLSSDGRLGLFALNYTLTTACLYHRQKHFFEESISTLPLMTILFSLLSALIQLPLLFGLESGAPFSFFWVITDLLLMPFADGIYAFFWFSLPILLLNRKPSLPPSRFQQQRPQ